MPRYRDAVHVDATSVRLIREGLELSQRAFACQLGVAHRTVIRWERNGALLDAETWALNSTLARLEHAAELAGYELV